MKLIIDVRERQLCKLIRALQMDEKIKYETIIKTLPLGDIIICDDNDNEKLIIERKSLNDLASSIIDGRYKEQSFRLDHTESHNHNIMYIIEGSMPYYSKRAYSKITASTLYSAMFTLNYYKGFSVIRTFNIMETAEWIIRMVSKLNKTKDKVGYYDTSSKTVTSEPPKTYNSVIKRVKKQNLRPDNIGEVILSQIPGISNATSLAVMNHFGSLYNLMMEIKKDANCLNTLTYTTKNGQQRHISYKSIESIVNYLLYQKENVIKVDTSS